MLKDFIRESIIEVLGDSVTEFSIEVPKNSEHGDYATNIAFLISKKEGSNPKEVADSIASKLSSDKKFPLEVNPIGPFINFSFKDDELERQVSLINENIKIDNLGKGVKVLLEYVSANPTGPLHIGHGRWAVIGEVLYRLLSKVGYKVTREFYVNDAGNQIVNFRSSVEAKKNGDPIPEDGYHGAYVAEIAKSQKDPVETMRSQQMDTLKMAGSEFDNWYSEKDELHDAGKVDHGIEVLKKTGKTFEQDGALWFKSTDYGDDKDRVIIKSDGLYTYFAADIAYHVDKFERGFERLINIWGADHHGYIKRIEGVIKALVHKDGDISDKFQVVIGQLVRLLREGKEVKMSKRTGEMITFREVVDEIGCDATRFFLAMKNVDHMLDFDLSLAKEKSSDNPVYYVQYAHARICSILNQAEGKQANGDKEPLIDAERNLIIKLMRYNDVVCEASESLEPYKMTQYAKELASTFHSFYQKCRIIQDDEVVERRIRYIKATKKVLADVLDLLGVSAPEKM